MTSVQVSSSKRRAPLRPLSALVLLVLVAGAVGIFTVTRGVVNDQQQRLLDERADEVKALLSASVSNIESSLRVLGPVGASTEPESAELFERSAERLLEGNTKTLGVAVQVDAGFLVQAFVGDGPRVGDRFSGERTSLAARALELEEPQLVSDILQVGDETRLLLARPVSGTRAVAYQESVIDPEHPAPAGNDSPFRELRVAVYAAAGDAQDRLLVTTEAELPLSGPVEQVTFPVGADTWLLVVAAREPLVGSFAHDAAWYFLAGGLAMALLATAIVETLGRRRTYALALVGERTRELERALHELTDARTFLERLLAAGPVVVARVGLADQTITYVSENVERRFGFSREDVLAPGFLASRTHPDDQSTLAEATGRIAQGDSVQEAIELRFQFGDGDVFHWVSVSLTPDIDDDGEVTGVVAYLADVNDRRRAEEAQREAQHAAETANRAKSEFLSRMSHELRTPLNAVLGFGQLLEIEPLTESQQDAVQHILKGGRHLLDLINEVLDISRIEAGQVSLSPEPVLARDLVRETVDLIRPLAERRGIQVVIDGADADCYMFADRQRVKQVLLNLLSNAVKYNRLRGSVAVSLDQTDANWVRIGVTDTGMGIPTERIGLLFVAFERLGAEQTSEEGTGIGLALSRRLAEAMGGTVRAESTWGNGSTFTVELPRVEGPMERYERLNGAVGAVGAVSVHPAQGPVVLHIEDNLSNLTLVERVLSQRNSVEVIAAMHGRLGLELAREHKPVLVLLDLHLPDMSGEQVLQRLRDDPATASIPVVIVSADATSGQVQRLLSAGAAAYLTKPIDVRELLRLLDHALDGR